MNAKLEVPYLESREGWSLFKMLIQSALTIQNCHKAILPNFAAPARNRPQAEQEEYERIERTSYAILLHSLQKWPALLSDVMKHPTVALANQDSIPKGSAVWTRITAEIQAPDNTNIQLITEGRIRRCTQGARTPKEYVAELDTLFALQPPGQAYTDERKINTLITGADAEYIHFLTDRASTPGVTYRSICSQFTAKKEVQDAVASGRESESKRETVATAQLTAANLEALFQKHVGERLGTLENQFEELATAHFASDRRSNSSFGSSNSSRYSRRKGRVIAGMRYHDKKRKVRFEFQGDRDKRKRSKDNHNAQVQCFNCRGYGHVKTVCPSKVSKKK